VDNKGKGAQNRTLCNTSTPFLKMRTASEIDLNKLLKTPRTTPFSSSTSLDHEQRLNTIRTERLRKLLLGTIEDDVAETCLSCDLLYPKTCGYFGLTCSYCISAHFCIFIDRKSSNRISQILTDLLQVELKLLRGTLLRCHADASNKNFAVVGFGEVDVEGIRDVLEKVRDGRLQTKYDLKGITIEYIKGVFESFE
jgi:hypothetical protein